MYSFLLSFGLQEVRFGDSVEDYVTEHQADYGEFQHQIAFNSLNINNQIYQSRIIFTDQGKFTFLYEGEEQQTPVAVHQSLPEYGWVKGELSVPPTVADLVAINPKMGTPIRMKDENTVETDKGTYTVIYSGETAHALMDGEKRVAVQSIPLTVTRRTRLYIDGLEEKTGKVKQITLSEWHPDKQSFYFEGENGLFRLEEFYTGAVKLDKAK